MHRRIVFVLSLFIILIYTSVCVSAAGKSAFVLSETGFDGDETEVFLPTASDKTALFTLEDGGWYFYGLNSTTGKSSKNGIPYVYSVVGKYASYDSEEKSNKTELMIDLSRDAYSLDGYSTLSFGISIVGENSIEYDVSTAVYTSGGYVEGETKVGVGWNLYSIDIRELDGAASHIRISVSYDEEIPTSIRVSAPYLSVDTKNGFAMAEKYLTTSLTASEGLFIQKSGRIKPENSRAILGGELSLINGELDGCENDNVYFELSISGATAGNFTMLLQNSDGEDVAQSKKISIDNSTGSFAVPIKVSGEVSSYTLVFDNIDCDVFFVLDYVKLRRFDTEPAKAESGLGQITKLKRSDDGVVFTGEMERAAAREYSESGDGLIHFYSVPAEHMNDLEYATELGQIKLTTVFEYTAQVKETVGMMFFAGVLDEDGGILPISKPRFVDSDSAVYLSDSVSSGVVTGLYDPAPVGAFEANISTVMTEVSLDSLISKSSDKTVSVKYTDKNGDEHELLLDRDKLSELDSDIEFYTTAGVRVYIRLLASSSDKSLVSAVVSFFSERYPYVMGYAVGEQANLNSTMESFSHGREDYEIEDYASDLALFYRTVYDSSPDSKAVIVPLSSSEGDISLSLLCVMLAARLDDIGDIPLVLMPESELMTEGKENEAYHALSMINELECGDVDGIVYFFRPTYDDISEKYAEYKSDGEGELTLTEYAAHTFASYASSLAGSRTLCVLFSLDNTSLRNSHDFYSVLKKADESSSHVYDSAAKKLDSSQKTGAEYVLCDFSDKYYADGWMAGGGVESCITKESSVLGVDGRVLSVSFKYDSYPTENSGSAGITLCNFENQVDMTNAEYIDFTVAVIGGGESTVVFVLGNDDSRAEFYAENPEHGVEYTFSCSLDGYEARDDVDYIGIMVYSDENVSLEVSSVSVRSTKLDEDGIRLLFEDGGEGDKVHIDYKLLALFAFTVAAVSVMAFVFLSKVDKDGAEDISVKKTGGRAAINGTGGRNEQKNRWEQ